MKSKRGNMLPEETLKIILGVIVIGFLVYLLAAIYFTSSDSKKLEQATSLVERIGEIIIDIENLENKINETHFGATPFGWYVFGFIGEELKPNQCSGNNCLCVCKKVKVNNVGKIIKDRQVQKCGEKGACVIIENLNKFDEFKLNGKENPSNIFISEVGSFIEVKEA